jgi:hypothetical protein
MIKKKGCEYILCPPDGIKGVSKTVIWEYNADTIEIEKTWEKGQIFAHKRRFLGLPAINKEALLFAFKEGKRFVRIKINKKGKQGIIVIPIKDWIKQAEEKKMIYHNPQSTDKHCSGYDDQYVLPVKLYNDNATGVAEEIKKEIWNEVGSPIIAREKIQKEIVDKVTGGQQTLF